MNLYEASRMDGRDVLDMANRIRNMEELIEKGNHAINENCKLRQRIRELEEQVDVFEDGLNKIKNWSIAYPLDIFPEPDLKKARELLKTGGIPLDQVTAHAMRHVVEGVGRIAREALDRGEVKG